MKALDMDDNYISFIEDVNETLAKQFGEINLDLKIVGYFALILSGLPDERETKDIDALKTESLSSIQNEPILNFLEKEFGRKSPGLYRHGMYLDFVPQDIIWLPPNPKFTLVKTFRCLKLLSLDPVDTCVSKAFSFFRSKSVRSNDRADIIGALDFQIIGLSEFIERIDEALPKYETHAEAPDTFPKLIEFINHDLNSTYGSSHSLKYDLPNWMKNM